MVNQSFPNQSNVNPFSQGRSGSPFGKRKPTGGGGSNSSSGGLGTSAEQQAMQSLVSEHPKLTSKAPRFSKPTSNVSSVVDQIIPKAYTPGFKGENFSSTPILTRQEIINRGRQNEANIISQEYANNFQSVDVNNPAFSERIKSAGINSFNALPIAEQRKSKAVELGYGIVQEIKNIPEDFINAGSLNKNRNLDLYPNERVVGTPGRIAGSIASGFVVGEILPKFPKFENLVAEDLANSGSNFVGLKNAQGEIDFTQVKSVSNPAYSVTQRATGRLSPVEGEPFLKITDTKVSTQVFRNGDIPVYGQVDIINKGVVRSQNGLTGGIVNRQGNLRFEFPEGFNLGKSRTNLISGNDVLSSNEYLLSNSKGAFTEFRGIDLKSISKGTRTGDVLDLTLPKARGSFNNNRGVIVDLTQIREPGLFRSSGSSKYGSIPSVSDVLGTTNQVQVTKSFTEFGVPNVLKSVQLPKVSPGIPPVLRGGGAEAILLNDVSTYSGTGRYELSTFTGLKQINQPNQSFNNQVNTLLLTNNKGNKDFIGANVRPLTSSVSRNQELVSLRSFQPTPIALKNILGLSQPSPTRQKQSLPTIQSSSQGSSPGDILGGFDFNFPSGRGFDFPLGFPGGDLLNFNPGRKTGRRKTKYIPSLISYELGITSRRIPKNATSGLTIRPIIIGKRRKRR